MPLQSRVNRTAAPVARPTEPQAGVDLNTSPRKRQSVAQAAAEPTPPRTDALEAQEQAEQTFDGIVGNQEAEIKAPTHPYPSESNPREQLAAVNVEPKKTRKPRTVKSKPGLPDDFSIMLETDDPTELRQNMRLVEETIKERRKTFEGDMQVFRRLYRDLGEKLAETL